MKMPVVLVLDEELLIAMDLEVALSDADFIVALATFCVEAERWLADQRPDAAILDIKSKDGHCVAVAKTLVAQSVPFIVVTDDRLANRDDAFRSGEVVVDQPALRPSSFSLNRCSQEPNRLNQLVLS